MIIHPPYDPIDECKRKLARVITIILAIAALLYLLTSCKENKSYYPYKHKPQQTIYGKEKMIYVYYNYGVYEVFIQKRCMHGWKFSDTLIFNNFDYE